MIQVLLTVHPQSVTVERGSLDDSQASRNFCALFSLSLFLSLFFLECWRSLKWLYHKLLLFRESNLLIAISIGRPKLQRVHQYRAILGNLYATHCHCFSSNIAKTSTWYFISLVLRLFNFYSKWTMECIETIVTIYFSIESCTLPVLIDFSSTGSLFRSKLLEI